MFIVMPYELITKDEKAIVYSYTSSININHEGMRKTLEELTKKQGWFQEEELKTLLEHNNIPLETGMEFLKANWLIKEKNPQSDDLWKQAAIITDNVDLFNGTTESWRAEGVDIYAIIDINHTLSPLPDDTLVWIHLENYRYDIIKKIYNNLKWIHNIAFIQSYYQKETFRIDGVYSPELGTPCHYCHTERWINREVKSFGQNAQSWGNLLNLLKENDMSLPAICVKSTERGFSRHLIKRRLQELIGNNLVNLHVDNLMSSICTDLITCVINREPVIHWYACDCFGN